jgi:hypothetical protein
MNWPHARFGHQLLGDVQNRGKGRDPKGQWSGGVHPPAMSVEEVVMSGVLLGVDDFKVRYT